jgi:hypothetical protein
VLGDVISSLEGLDRGDLEIGDPSDDEFDIDDIPDEATDVFRVTPSLDTGIIENGPDGFVL